jgi:hypothetical protein
VRLSSCAIAGSLGLIAALPVVAHVTQWIVESTTPREPTKSGALPYETIRGRFYGELDPADPHNRIITDLQYAPRNERGKVEYSATFELAKPLDLSKSSGVLFYDVPNRGYGPALPDEDGHIRVVSGWQGDIAPGKSRQTATVPTAEESGGKPLTGLVLARLTTLSSGKKSLPITGGIGQGVPLPLPVSLATRRAHLYRQTADDQPLAEMSRRDWSFGDCDAKPFPGTPDPTKLCLRDGFDPDQGYTLVYEGKAPQVLGIGFAATRDLIEFLRHAQKDDKGTANPVSNAVHWSVASGTSQSGNFLRSFIHLGFNADESNRIVFDGINPNIAARHVPLNLRFGVPGGAANLFDAGSEGVLWWTPYDDTARGRGRGSLLDRCRASNTCPKVVETFGSAEFWGLRMSPDLVGTDAQHDLPLPDNVRRYYFPSVTHGGAYRGGFSTKGEPSGVPQCELPGNPNPSKETFRLLQKALVAWVKEGREPPQSRYPTLAAGDLVEPTVAAMGWPAIPNAPVPEGKLNPLLDYDFGGQFHYQDDSGIATTQPPKIRKILPSRVPRVNTDGNETSGVPSVQLLVPLGTYTGWNVVAKGYGKNTGCGFVGGFIPFARTAAEREASGDPRLSLEERYKDHEGFVGRVRDVVAQQVADGWLLPDDAEKLITQAEASDVLR